MQLRSWIFPIVLCLSLLCLFGCSSDDLVPPTESVPAEQINDLYDSACNSINAASNLSLTIDTSETRVAGGESYTRKISGTALYTGMGTGNMEALITENMSLGTYQVQYLQSYINGASYCQVNDCSFTASMTPEEFAANQLPAVLLEPSNYSTITGVTSGGTFYVTFTDATRLEDWAVDSVSAKLVSASGKATLDANGTMLSTSYHAEYLLSTTAYTLDVNISINLPQTINVHSMQPAYPANCTPLTCFQAPRMLLQVVGDVYTSHSITGKTTETIYCEAVPATRTQTVQIDTYGRGDSFMAHTDYTVSLTDYANNTITNTKTELFRNGAYSYTANGSAPITQSGITAQKMRSYCEDSLLAALLTPNYLAGAELTDTGDFYCLTFQGTDAFAENIYDKIYSILTINLDAYASSYTTKEITGYLTISKHTGLPTAMGIYMSRSHIIEKVPYETTYQLDQSLTLSSATAYQTITGEALPENAPA